MSRAAPNLGESPGEIAGAVAGDDSALVADVPLTVAAVAARLGVAPSTLRTWDRRYGLGPSGRSAGSHRRYTPEDVARLETMRRLTLAGAAPSDAARVAGLGAPTPALASVREPTGPVLVDGLTLAAAAVEGADDRLHGLLSAAVHAHGVVGAWEDVARPAFRFLAGREPSDRPGRDPEPLLAAAVLAVVREVADAAAAGREVPDARPRVALIADPTSLVERVAAHLLAAALAERGIAARVVAGAADLEVFLRLLEGAPSRAVCVVGGPPGGEQVARAASEHGGLPVFLVGADSPEVWLPGVSRVRTLAGALPEIADLLAAGTGAGGVSRGDEAPT